jgi:hypothetical protein
MYNAVRKNAPQGLVIIGGTGYAQDAAGLLAIAEQYRQDYKTPMTNVLWNLHPYQGMFQGVWISMRSTLRLTLALQQLGPVIYTELVRRGGASSNPPACSVVLTRSPSPPHPLAPQGQYCCNSNDTATGAPQGKCNDHTHGDWFVHNLLNMAAQLDVSWTGWAWRGTVGGDCGYPDMRANATESPDEAVLTDGRFGGANWKEVWALYAAAKTIVVVDAGDPTKIGVNDTEVKGFLPRPCIVPNFGMGSSCGWPLGANVSRLPSVSMWNQSVGESVLPGLPPMGPPSACYEQACPGYTCSNESSVVPMPEPCHTPALD